jgi:hypothetical protein
MAHGGRRVYVRIPPAPTFSSSRGTCPDGLTQFLTDRRVWIKHTPEGKLILHDHVDDIRITATTDAVRIAIEQRLRRESPRRRAGVASRLIAIGAALSARPRLFEGDADAAIGYDASGVPR